nr:MAG TPA: hypothetical protein [Caudoviricetes sp.]
MECVWTGVQLPSSPPRRIKSPVYQYTWAFLVENNQLLTNLSKNKNIKSN